MIVILKVSFDSFLTVTINSTIDKVVVCKWYTEWPRGLKTIMNKLIYTISYDDEASPSSTLVLTSENFTLLFLSAKTSE